MFRSFRYKGLVTLPDELLLRSAEVIAQTEENFSCIVEEKREHTSSSPKVKCSDRSHSPPL